MNTIFVDRHSEVAAIKRRDVNFVIFSRNIDRNFQQYLDSVVNNYVFSATLKNKVIDVEYLTSILPRSEYKMMLQWDMKKLFETYDQLFQKPTYEISFQIINKDTCIKYHVDHIDMRMICTYAGPPTQWVKESETARQWLAADLPVYRANQLITKNSIPYSLKNGDVGFMKGEKYPENAGKGIVHRAPLLSGRNRLVFCVT